MFHLTRALGSHSVLSAQINRSLSVCQQLLYRCPGREPCPRIKCPTTSSKYTTFRSLSLQSSHYWSFVCMFYLVCHLDFSTVQSWFWLSCGSDLPVTFAWCSLFVCILRISCDAFSCGACFSLLGTRDKTSYSQWYTCWGKPTIVWNKMLQCEKIPARGKKKTFSLPTDPGPRGLLRDQGLCWVSHIQCKEYFWSPSDEAGYFQKIS